MDPTLKKRLTFGPLMMAGLLALLWFDHWAQGWTRDQGINHVKADDGPAAGVGGIGLLVLLLIVLPPATLELATLFAAERVRPYRVISALGSGALVIHAFCTQFRKFQLYATSVLAFIIVCTMLLAALRRAMGRQTQEAITHMAGTVLATLYLGGLAWFLMALRVKHSARIDRYSGTTMIIVLILLTVKFTDIGAFFGGRKFGKHKLIPWLSPGKTWEGLFFGLLAAGAVGAALSPLISKPNDQLGLPGFQLEWWKGLIFGIVIGGVGQLGDLLESLFKRDAEVKDSSQLIPGFGGVLDVIDSPLLAAPVAYLLFSLF